MTGETGPSSPLREELKRLCRGRGVLAADLRAGPELGRRSGAGEQAGRAQRRAVLTEWLTSWSAALPADLSLAARVALGLHPDARQRFLGERIGWLAARLDRDERTARRRVDEAVGMLADLVEKQEPRRGGASSDFVAPPAWYCESIRTLLRLDLPEPEVHEERRIVATGRLSDLTVTVSLPKADEASGPGRDLLAEVMYGGVLRRRERPSESLFAFVIEMPRTLQAGDRHRFALRFRLPSGQPMAPHYALTPLTRCEEFVLRVRFPPDRPPRRLWLLRGIPPRSIDDDPGRLPTIDVDRAGETEARFAPLDLGLGYGFRWQQ